MSTQYGRTALVTVTALAAMFGNENYRPLEFKRITWDKSPKISVLRSPDELEKRKKRRRSISRRKKKRGY